MPLIYSFFIKSVIFNINKAIRLPPIVLRRKGYMKKTAITSFPNMYLEIGNAKRPPIKPVPII